MNSVPNSRYYLFSGLAGVVLATDLISKSMVFSHIGHPGQTTWFIDSWLKFRFRTSFNEGALWGIGQGMTPVFTVLSVAALAGIFYWLFVCEAARSAVLTISLALITGGTLGNLYDRLAIHGWPDPRDENRSFHAVRDFFDVQFGSFEWAIFNVADACLVVGAGLLVFESFRAGSHAETTKGQPVETVSEKSA